MFRHAALARLARVGAGRMEKSSPGAAGAVYHIFGQQLVVVRIVVIFVADDINQAAPAMPEADDLIALAESAVSDTANCGVEAGNVAAPGKNDDDELLRTEVSHV